MKNSIFVLAITVLTFVGCKKETDKNDAATDSTTVLKDSAISTEAATQSLRECYQFVQMKDTISLSYDQNGANVKGQMQFKNYEKDSSKGDVEGIFAGDTLKLDYTFQSEGTTSVREIYLLKSGNSLQMGIGDMEDKAGKMVFSKPKSVKYIKDIVLVKTECKK